MLMTRGCRGKFIDVVVISKPGNGKQIYHQRTPMSGIGKKQGTFW